MSSAPIQDIDLATFNFDPYPVLELLRNNLPITYVPQLKATLFSKHQDIFICEKNIEIFSSVQPNGLMTKLMGQNMMRKDGATHMAERKAIFPTVSPKTVKNFWRDQFVDKTNEILSHLRHKKELEIVSEFSTQVSAEALKLITGLSEMKWMEMDRVSQGMIDGCSNYISDPVIAKNCDAKLPQSGDFNDEDKVLLEHAYSRTIVSVREQFDAFKYHDALQQIWRLVDNANGYIDAQAPWTLKKTDEERMRTVLYVLVETIRCLGILIQPFMPESAAKILDQVCVAENERNFECLSKDYALKADTVLPKPEGVFPRIELEEAAA